MVDVALSLLDNSGDVSGKSSSCSKFKTRMIVDRFIRVVRGPPLNLERVRDCLACAIIFLSMVLYICL